MIPSCDNCVRNDVIVFRADVLILERGEHFGERWCYDCVKSYLKYRAEAEVWK